jgi:hypothetical protein
MEIAAVKIKNRKEEREFYTGNFTGIQEWCDGMAHVDWISIDHFKNGNRHREDGPAVEWESGGKWWYLDGIRYSTEEDWKTEVERLQKNKNTLVTAK